VKAAHAPGWPFRLPQGCDRPQVTRMRGPVQDPGRPRLREVRLDPEWLAEQVCARAGRTLTRAEWALLVGETDHRDVCPGA
jgi:hypothetical protein